jgi:hypothetical protein
MFVFFFRSFLCDILAVVINCTAFEREAVPLFISDCAFYMPHMPNLFCLLGESLYGGTHVELLYMTYGWTLMSDYFSYFSLLGGG